MSAAEDDTELRDLLIQNLENSGVLNKLKVKHSGSCSSSKAALSRAAASCSTRPEATPAQPGQVQPGRDRQSRQEVKQPAGY